MSVLDPSGIDVHAGSQLLTLSERCTKLDHCGRATRSVRGLMQKRFAKTAGDFKPLACGYGACFATDRIKVDGMRVRFMYREKAGNSIDSG